MNTDDEVCGVCGLPLDGHPNFAALDDPTLIAQAAARTDRNAPPPVNPHFWRRDPEQCPNAAPIGQPPLPRCALEAGHPGPCEA